MLDSLLGIRLVLWAGKSVPTPVSYEVSHALLEAEVTNDSDGLDGFQLKFQLKKEATGSFSLLADGTFDPFTRVIIGVLLGAVPEALIDGFVEHHQLDPGGNGEMPTLTVTGKDVRTMMNLEEKNAPYKNQPDSIIVSQILASYLSYGLAPVVTPTTDVPLETDRVPRQQETDLEYVKRLAERNGFVFYIEPTAFGVNTAYWGVESRAGVPQPALTQDMGSYTNVESLDFAQDALAPASVEGSFVDPLTKMSIPIPSLPSLKIPPLASRPVEAKRKVLLRESANQGSAQAMTTSAATVTNQPDAVTGHGSLDTARYGNILRARQLVGVRGVGTSYDGNYYVRKVTHRISAHSYKQAFTISREGTGSLLPVVIL